MNDSDFVKLRKRIRDLEIKLAAAQDSHKKETGHKYNWRLSRPEDFERRDHDNDV